MLNPDSWFIRTDYGMRHNALIMLGFDEGQEEV